MRLRNHRARADDLPALAPGVASSADVIQPPKGLGQVFCFWQSTLAGRFTRTIKVKDDPPAARSIYQAPGLLLVGKRATLEIIEKDRAQGVDRCLGQCRQKARARRTGGQLSPLKQGHEGNGKGLQPRVEGFQSAFPTDGIAEEDREKIDHLVASETPSRKAHALTDLGQDTLL